MTVGQDPDYGDGAAARPDAPPAPPTPSPPSGRSWPGVLALMLVVGLGAGLVFQTTQLIRVSDRLDEADARLAAQAVQLAEGRERYEALASRTDALQGAVAGAFDPVGIAGAVLPSIFKVTDGKVTGTAFAVGAPADDGGTNLLTNYHVVERAWQGDGQQLSLHRSDERYPAEIVAVHEDADLAWLHSPESFPGLATAEQQVPVGEPVVSVGTPLGLSQTVTTGVVGSADRQLPDDSGPWIQFDAAVEPGSSGGPVINSANEVVGIATREANEFEGIGFAAPVSRACELFEICGHP